MKISTKFFALLCLVIFCAVNPDIVGAASKKKRVAPTPQTSGKIITVSAEGVAPVTEGRKAEAREAARRELIHNALDIAVGSFVESVTMLEQGTAQNAVQKIFEKAGFTIIYPSQAKILHNIDLEAAHATGNYSAIRNAARNFRADVIIVGSAGASISSKQRINGQTLYAVASSVRLEAVLTDTAQSVGSEEFSWRPRRAVDCSLSYGEGAAKGLSWCATMAATSIVNKVAYALTRSGEAGALGGMTVKIIIRNIDYSTVRKLKNELALMQGVSGVYQRRYINGSELEFDIVSDKTADDIAGILADMDYEITDMSKSVVEGRRISQ